MHMIGLYVNGQRIQESEMNDDLRHIAIVTERVQKNIIKRMIEDKNILKDVI